MLPLILECSVSKLKTEHGQSMDNLLCVTWGSVAKIPYMLCMHPLNCLIKGINFASTGPITSNIILLKRVAQ